MSSRSTNIPALDGLRGIAILAVLAYHFTLYGGLEPSVFVDKVFYAVTMAGWLGVDLFFVLSGFLITGILADTKGAEHFFRNFYIRRCLRIFPLYYGVLALFFVVLPRVLPAGVAGASYQDLLAQQSWYWTYLINVKIAASGWPGFSALGHFWSLAVEEQFYLVWPVLVFLLRRDTLVKVCVALIVVALGARIGFAWAGQPVAAYVLAPARMDALALGALLSLMARTRNGLLTWQRAGWFVMVAAGSLLVALSVWRRGLWYDLPLVFTVGFTSLALFFGALLTLAITSAEGSVLKRLLCSRLLKFFGRYSYGLYVFHHPIVLLLREFFTAPDFPTVFGSQLPGLAVYAAVAGSASLAIALLSWRFYETPFLMLKEKFQSATRVSGVVVSQF